MTPSHLILDEAPSWFFNLILLIFAGAIVWLGYLVTEGFCALLGLRPLRKTACEASVPTAAIGTVVWFKTCVRLAFFVFVTYGTWVAVDANLRSFRLVDISDTAIHIAYNWHSLDRDISRSAVRTIDLVQVSRRPGYRLEIVTTDGSSYRSVMTYDKTIIADCQRIADGFHK